MASTYDTIQNAVKVRLNEVERWFYRAGGEQRFYRVINGQPITLDDATENADTTFCVVLSEFPELEEYKERLMTLYVDGWKFDCDDCV